MIDHPSRTFLLFSSKDFMDTLIQDELVLSDKDEGISKKCKEPLRRNEILIGIYMFFFRKLLYCSNKMMCS